MSGLWVGRRVASRVWLGIAACLFLLLCVTVVPTKAEDTSVTIGVGDTVLVVSGRTSPNAFVTLLDGGSTIGTTTADALGNFTKTFTAYTPGLRQIGVYARDVQNRITATATDEVNVQEHFQTNTSFFLPTTLEIDSSTVVQGDTVRLAGSTVPNGEVLIVIDNNSHVTVTANANGDWEYTLATNNLSPGSHALYAKVTDPLNAEQSYSTAKMSITILSPAALAPFLPPAASSARTPSPPVIVHPANGITVEGTELTVRGTAEPHTLIRLYNGSRIIGSAFADAQGNWEITIVLSEPSYSIRARACRLLKCSEFSRSITFFWESSAKLGAGLSARLERCWFLLMRGETVTHTIQIDGGTLPYFVSIEWDDGSKERLEVNGHTATLQHKYDKAGHFTGHIRVTDAQGGTVALTFAADVLEPYSDSSLFSLLLVLLLCILLLLAYYVYRRRRRKKRE